MALRKNELAKGDIPLSRIANHGSFRDRSDSMEPIPGTKPSSPTSPLAYNKEALLSTATGSTSSMAIRKAELQRIHSSKMGSVISFHNINYEVTVKKKRKIILKDVSGIFGPGMNAIMGPTGGGKSSCLDVLAGRKDPQGLSGYVLIDGHKQPKNFKCMCGYVLQDDIVMGTMTVKENLMFSAQVRLPEQMSLEEKQIRVARVIKELGLQQCANTKIGNEFIRGVSSSERKRCNIGIEMITQPPVLFLDEPTTGLDANTANSVCQLLLKLAKRGRTIIFSIHQPRFSIYKLFDRLLLLSLGEVVYHGPAHEAVSYLAENGFPIEEFNNPADFFLDVLNADTESDVRQREQEEELQDKSAVLISGEAARAKYNRALERHDMLLKAYQGSHWRALVDAECDPIIDGYKERLDSGTETPITDVDHATSWSKQMKMVAGRTAMNTIRMPQTTFVQVGVMVCQAIIIGLIYLQIGDNPVNAIEDRTGAFFLILMNMVFGNMSSVDLFIRERPIFIHENISGFYRVSVYFVAKIISDLIPRRIMPSIFFATITYFLMGLQIDVGKFFFYMLTLSLANIAASAVAFAASASVNVYVVANMFTGLIYVFMMVFAGKLVNLNQMPGWISWIKYGSIQYHAYNAMVVNELNNTLFCPEGNYTLDECDSGTEFFETQGIKYDTAWHLWQNIVALACLALGFMIMAYIQLLRMKKLK